MEAGIKYVQNNALKAKKFAGLPQETEHLAHWEATVADTRIHGTTRRQVGRIFRDWRGRPTQRCVFQGITGQKHLDRCPTRRPW